MGISFAEDPIDGGIECKLRSRIRETPVTGSQILRCQAFDGSIEFGPNDVAFKYKSARPSTGIFGSAARDSLKDQSDVDSVVALEDPVLFNLIGIEQVLEERFNCAVDVAWYRDKMNGFLKYNMTCFFMFHRQSAPGAGQKKGRGDS